MLNDEQLKEALAKCPSPELVTKEHVEKKIHAVNFFNPTATLTVCVLELENGFNVVGQSAPVDPANFNKEIGQKVAYEQAFGKVWEFEGYLWKQSLYYKKQGDGAEKAAA